MRVGMRWVLALAVVVGLSACVDGSGPDASACAAPSVELDLRLTADGLTPAPSVCRDQEVTLRIASEVDGIFHIHGYDHAVSASEVAAGDTLELTFTADTAGQFPIELHPADDPEGVAVAVFTVHEP